MTPNVNLLILFPSFETLKVFDFERALATV